MARRVDVTFAPIPTIVSIPEKQYNFEQIFLIGIHPDEESDSQPKILLAFPPYEMPCISPEAVVSRALPLGAQKRCAKSGSNLIQEEFAFLMKKGGKTLYGASIIFLPNEAKTLPFFVSNATKKTLYSLCIVSKVPSIASHLSYLTFLVKALCGKVNDIQSIHVNPNDANYECYKLIDGLTEHSCGFGTIKNFPIPDYLYDSVSLYRMCCPGTQPIDLSSQDKILFPPNFDKRQIVYSGLDTLFSVLDVKNIIDVIAGILLDYQVLVIGSSMEEVSMTVLTLAHIIDPLEYSGMVIPLLPATKSEYFELLGAPTPYIIGTLPCADFLDIEFLDTTIFLNLDKKIIQIDRKFPTYPNKNYIVSTLKKTVSKAPKQSGVYTLPEEHISRLKHKYMFTPKTCTTIIETLMQPFGLILSDFISSFFITEIDGTQTKTVFNMEIFKECLPKDDYLNEFIETQTFDIWVTKKLEEHMKMKGEEFKTLEKKPAAAKKRDRKKSLSTKLLGLDSFR